MKHRRQNMAMMALALALLWCLPAAAADEVSLLSAFSSVGSRYGVEVQSTKVRASVKTLPGLQSVAVRMKVREAKWLDVPMEAFSKSGDGREIWVAYGLEGYFEAGFIEEGLVRDIEFVLKVVTDQGTFYDNNGGRNYYLEARSGPLLPEDQRVLLDRAILGRDSGAGVFVFEGEVLTADGLDDAEVSLVYTVDGWKSSDVIWAKRLSSYEYGYGVVASPNEYGVSYWRFRERVNLPVESSLILEFAIRLKEGPHEYWDNNKHGNYRRALSAR